MLPARGSPGRRAALIVELHGDWRTFHAAVRVAAPPRAGARRATALAPGHAPRGRRAHAVEYTTGLVARGRSRAGRGVHRLHRARAVRRDAAAPVPAEPRRCSSACSSATRTSRGSPRPGASRRRTRARSDAPRSSATGTPATSRRASSPSSRRVSWTRALSGEEIARALDDACAPALAVACRGHCRASSSRRSAAAARSSAARVGGIPDVVEDGVSGHARRSRRRAGIAAASSGCSATGPRPSGSGRARPRARERVAVRRPRSTRSGRRRSSSVAVADAMKTARALRRPRRATGCRCRRASSGSGTRSATRSTLRVLASAADGGALDGGRVRAARPSGWPRSTALAFYARLPFRVARAIRRFRPERDRAPRTRAPRRLVVLGRRSRGSPRAKVIVRGARRLAHVHAPVRLAVRRRARRRSPTRVDALRRCAAPTRCAPSRPTRRGSCRRSSATSRPPCSPRTWTSSSFTERPPGRCRSGRRRCSSACSSSTRTSTASRARGGASRPRVPEARLRIVGRGTRAADVEALVARAAGAASS